MVKILAKVYFMEAVFSTNFCEIIWIHANLIEKL